MVFLARPQDVLVVLITRRSYRYALPGVFASDSPIRLYDKLTFLCADYMIPQALGMGAKAHLHSRRSSSDLLFLSQC
jgi:hypothetical protein